LRRSEFLGVVGGAAAVWPVRSLAQKTLIRIGLLGSGAANSAVSLGQIAAIKQGLRENGLIDGRDYVLEARFAAGNYERFPEMARELAQAKVSVILTNTIASVRAAQRLTPPLPIVMIAINDPIGTGLVASLARPGGHTTGMATLNEDLTPKLLEFERAILPKAKVIAALFNPSNPTNLKFLEDLRPRARAMGITMEPVELKSPDALDAAFSSLVARHPDALQVLADSGTMDLSERLAGLALSHRLPSFTTAPNLTEFGFLLSYGPSRDKLLIRSGYFVKRILEGANPSDLPVEQPTQVELWINLKTAKTLGLDIPVQLQQLADHVIE
jgi:putative tryptophan/tyrosine transport system substrate-binding protein